MNLYKVVNRILRRISLSRRKLFTVLLTTFLVSFLLSKVLFINDIYVNDLIYKIQSKFTSEDVQCYFEKSYEDDFYSDEMREDADMVFMHSTSCEPSVKLHHLCAMEAAAKAFNHTKVYVLFNKPLYFCECQKEVIRSLMSYRNLEFNRLNIKKYLAHTPMWFFGKNFNNSILNNGTKKYQRVEEVLKLATLYKFGGRVIDIDMILTKAITLPTWVVKDGNFMTADAVGFIDEHNPIVTDGIRFLLRQSPHNINATKALTAGYENLCKKKLKSDAIINDACEEIYVSRFKIYNVKYTDRMRRWKSSNSKSLPPAFAYRVLDDSSQRRFVRNSLLAAIARRYCPIVYDHYLHMV